jgi:acetyl esterase
VSTDTAAIPADVLALLAQLNDVFPRLGTEITDAAEARRAFAALRRAPTEPVPVALVEQFDIRGPDREPLALRRYLPQHPIADAVVLFLHGGGWVLGGLDSHDDFARRLAAGTGAETFAVDYRLAPEHPFPAALDDCYRALEYLAELRPRAQVVLCGDSAGASLAIGSCLVARERGGPMVAGQALLYPVTDPACSSPSFTENAKGFYITAAHLRWFWRQYLREDGLRRHPYVSLVDVADLAALPPAHVVTAELDPLRDEGERFARRLEDAGVPVSLVRYGGAFHGFLLFPSQLELARDAHRELWGAMRGLFNRDLA